MLGLGNSTAQMYSVTPVFINDWAISLNGIDEYINCDAGEWNVDAWSEIHEQGSISIWAKVDTTGSTGTMVRLHLDSNNFISLYYHGATNTTRTSYRGGGSTTVAKSSEAVENSGNWHHFVSTWNASGQIKLYIDGVLQESKPNSGTVGDWGGTSDIEDVHIGQNTLDSTYFNGTVNDFSLWNRELLLAKVQAIYNNGVPNDLMTESALAPITSLIAYYKFEDISDTGGEFTASIKNHSPYTQNVAVLINTPSYVNT